MWLPFECDNLESACWVWLSNAVIIRTKLLETAASDQHLGIQFDDITCSAFCPLEVYSLRHFCFHMDGNVLFFCFAPAA